MTKTYQEIAEERVRNCTMSKKLNVLTLSGLYHLTEIPPLPPTLRKLQCNQTRITKLPDLPDSLEILECYRTELNELPPLPERLEILECQCTNITTLPPLPSSLRRLNCSNTLLTELPPLPFSLGFLDCWETQIRELPLLPPSLLKFFCYSRYLHPEDCREDDHESLKDFIQRNNKRILVKKMLRRSLPIVLHRVSERVVPKDCLLVEILNREIAKFL